MKLTNGELFASGEPFQKLIKRDDIPVKYSFPIVQLVKKLGPDMAAIDDQRVSLVNKYEIYQERDEAAGQFTIKSRSDEANVAKFIVDFNELMKIETVVQFTKVKVPDNIQITGQDLAALEPFIEVVEG